MLGSRKKKYWGLDPGIISESCYPDDLLCESHQQLTSAFIPGLPVSRYIVWLYLGKRGIKDARYFNFAQFLSSWLTLVTDARLPVLVLMPHTRLASGYWPLTSWGAWPLVWVTEVTGHNMRGCRWGHIGLRGLTLTTAMRLTEPRLWSEAAVSPAPATARPLLPAEAGPAPASSSLSAAENQQIENTSVYANFYVAKLHFSVANECSTSSVYSLPRSV